MENNKENSVAVLLGEYREINSWLRYLESTIWVITFTFTSLSFELSFEHWNELCKNGGNLVGALKCSLACILTYFFFSVIKKFILFIQRQRNRIEIIHDLLELHIDDHDFSLEFDEKTKIVKKDTDFFTESKKKAINDAHVSNFFQKNGVLAYLFKKIASSKYLNVFLYLNIGLLLFWGYLFFISLSSSFFNSFFKLIELDSYEYVIAFISRCL